MYDDELSNERFPPCTLPVHWDLEVSKNLGCERMRRLNGDLDF